MEHSEPHRALAADTLAYLTEVDSDLQQIAAISNQLVIALMELLKCPSIAARGAAFRYGIFIFIILSYNNIVIVF